MKNVIVLFGRAAAGKDCIMQELLKLSDGQLNEVISATSRPPREGEVDGKNYYFMSKAEFELSIQHNDMIEYTEFNNWYYGISAETIQDGWNIAVINPEGIKRLKQFDNLNLICIYLYAPDKVRLLRQLQRENDPDVREIIRRYKADENDFPEEVIDEYADIWINNDGVREPASIARQIWLILQDYGLSQATDGHN